MFGVVACRDQEMLVDLFGFKFQWRTFCVVCVCVRSASKNESLHSFYFGKQSSLDFHPKMAPLNDSVEDYRALGGFRT